MAEQNTYHPIGVFDSGFGGLTILKALTIELPQYDYIYLGDNARTPYGTRSFETVYQFTLECVKKLFGMGCNLVVLACNTASAKALRTIQQHDLPIIDPSKRVLGVIRPSVEQIGAYTKTKKVGVLGTSGTVLSESYVLEINKLFPDIKVYQEACPMWVPLVENNEYASDGADFFVKKHIEGLLSKNNSIDTIILGCTHYPLLIEKILKYTPSHIRIISQGEIVASSLKDYLYRHPEMEIRCSKGSRKVYYTTESARHFDNQASIFSKEPIQSTHLAI
ncbi:MAG: glutamate racemase [Bacteroidetes bacterium]|nr:glutamate racemase [Bacteroidota bacterium]